MNTRPVMPTLALGWFFIAASVSGAQAKTVAECLAEYTKCHNNCKPGGFSCDLLIKFCADDYKKCYDGASDKVQTLDPTGGGLRPFKRPATAVPLDGIIEQQK